MIKPPGRGETGVKRVFNIFLTVLKWALLTALGVEIFCFLVITAANLMVFNQPWEGSAANYDAYATFLTAEGVKPTLHNLPAAAPGAGGQAPRRLWLLGGSTMRGGWVQPGETIPSYLAGILNRPGRGGRVEVTNYGENSFNSLLETKYLQELLIKATKTPDLIIFYDGANDCAYFNEYRSPQAHYGYRRLQGLIESYRRSYFSLFKPLCSALYASSTLEVYDRFRQTMVAVHPENPVPRAFVAETGERYEHVRKLAGAYGADFVLVWQPILWVETGAVNPRVKEKEADLEVMGARFSRVRENFATTYDMLAGSLSDKPFLMDFRNALTSRTTPVYEADGVHLKAAGNEMVAARLATVLKGKGW